jgi:hypothetical protein
VVQVSLIAPSCAGKKVFCCKATPAAVKTRFMVFLESEGRAMQIGRRPNRMFGCSKSAISRLMLSVGLGVGSLALLWALAACGMRGEEPSQAGVVIQFDEAAVRTVQFSQPISGIKALELSGLDFEVAETSFGPAVCSIEGVGCPATDCFCGGDNFWNYTYWDGAAWQSYPVGAGSSVISRTGSYEGWRWGPFGSGLIPPSQAQAAQDALGWLQAQQVITDGGYGSVGAAVETLLAVGANHIDAGLWRRQPDSPSLLHYVQENGPAYSRFGVAEAGKLAVALAAVEGCYPEGALTPAGYYSPTLGAYSDQSGPLAWAILGALSISDTVSASNVQTLLDLAQPQGGWEWSPGWGTDTNSTALAVQALVGAGAPLTSTAIISALAYFHTAQNPDGGFPYDPNASFGRSSDANSTSYVIQALWAAQSNPTSPTWTIGDANPISFLLSLQLDDGSLEWQPGQGPSALATAQAVPALLGAVYPLHRSPAACQLGFAPVTPEAGGDVPAGLASATQNLERASSPLVGAFWQVDAPWAIKDEPAARFSPR